MITERLQDWRVENNFLGYNVNRAMFDAFIDEEFEGKTFTDVIKALAYAIHELEVCVEGLIEDLEV